MEYIVLWIYGALSAALAALCWWLHYFLRDRLKARTNKQAAEAALHFLHVGKYAFIWYCVSVTLTLFNKWFLNEWAGTGFRYPITATAIHFVIKFFLTRGWARYNDIEVEHLSWELQFRTTIPIAIATAGDVALSNMSMRHISVTTYTIVKAGSLIWIYIWGVLLGLEKLRSRTVFILVVITGGIVMATIAPGRSSILGIALVFTATVLSGMRWGLTQLLTRVDEQSNDTVICLYHFAHWSALFIIPVALGMEHGVFSSEFFTHADLAAEFVGLILFAGLISFALIFAEVVLVKITSSLTLGVLGQVKELLQIVLAMMVFNDQLTVLNMVGLAISIVGAYAYRVVRQADDQEDAKRDFDPLGKELSVFDVKGPNIYDDDYFSDDELLGEDNIRLLVKS